MELTAQDTQKLGATFVALLRSRASHHPDKNVYTFLLDGETQEACYSYAELDFYARGVAALLQNKVKPGSRALLLYQPGLEYIAAIFGCWYAGVIAVPAYPPRLNHNMARIESIIQDAQATVALTTSTILTSLRRKFSHDPLLLNLSWIETDTLTPDVVASWHEWYASKESLALLQYTSGSTGSPKGVMVTHDNLMQNAAIIQEGMSLKAESPVGSWLPPYHDMGLMGGILEAVYVGSSSVLMAPTAFLQQPLRWLRMVSRYHVQASGGPNFAFDLCVRKAKATPEQLVDLNLSSWKVAFCGAEPIQAETVAQFTDIFTPYNFRKETFYPCYGLAETTLFVTGVHQWEAPQVLNFDAAALETGKVLEAHSAQQQNVSFIGCGHARAGQQISIVDPEQHTRCAPNQVGEIWYTAPNVAQGYWGKEEETQQTFHAYIQDSGEGPFLRTGDLGFFKDGELFVTGRLKDMIIIRGRNLYPQDIERVVEKSHPALRPGSCAAFSVPGAETERVVIVQEVERHYEKWDVQEIVQAIRQAISAEFEIDVLAIELLRAGLIYKTSSNKIQRRACRQGFLKGDLQAVYRWRQDSGEAQKPETPFVEDEKIAADEHLIPTKEVQAPSKTLQEIGTWLTAHIAKSAHLNPLAIDRQAPLVQYGLNSLEAVGLSGELEQWLGRSLSPTLIYDYPSINALAHYLAPEGQATSTASQQDGQQPLQITAIAIVGMACRFPGAKTPEEFWQFLRAGGDGISEATNTRWQAPDWYDPHTNTPHPASTQWGGFLTDIDTFDPGFFNISPREAEYIDPQQRLLLEVAWEAFEQAGFVPAELAGSQTGVFVGVSSSDYYVLHHTAPDYHQAYAGTGNAHSIAANRLSYFFDFHGPSIAIDTACSSSLLAIHQACQSLRSGECSLALAGGVNVMLTPELTTAFSQAHMMAGDGRCKTFDESADGYVRSEGCGIIILKPLEEAQRAGDPILAVIRGSAVNQDGASNGLTAPSGRAQEAVIRQALKNAGIGADQIGYVETHGTGTSLGDPIEVNALKAVLMPRPTPEQTCVLGAVKTNIGHLEAAAGVASVIKIVQSLRHDIIPPNIHFSALNPHIEVNGTTFVFPTEERQWPSIYERRIAGVSAFGFGGTNAHAILEAAPIHPQTPSAAERSERPSHVLTMSARSDVAVQQLAVHYQDWLHLHPEVALADLCFSANTGRTHFSHRLALQASSTQELQERLRQFTSTHQLSATIGSQGSATPPGKVVFLFTGQGAQYVGMARQLYQTQPVFRRELERCAQLMQSYLDKPLLSILYPVDKDISLQSDTAFIQPALFALEYALAALWQSWGIKPDMVIGHSVGEYAAACVAGMMSLEEGLQLISLRGKLMQDLPIHGAMLAIFTTRAHLEPLLKSWPTQLSIAVVNGPQHIVVAGAEDALLELTQLLEKQNIDFRTLKVPYAFHSPLLEPMLDTFARAAHEVHWQASSIPLIRNLDGQLLASGATLDASYWRRQTRETVQFATSIQTAYEQGGQIFIEIGPHNTLLRLGQRCLTDPALSWLPSLQQKAEDVQTVFSSIMALYTQGYKIDWHSFDQPFVHPHLLLPTLPTLPTYPFERKRYWFTSSLPLDRSSAQNSPGQSNHTNHIAFHNEQDNVMQTDYVSISNSAPSQPGAEIIPRQERLLSQLRVLLGSLLHIEPQEIAGNTSFLEIGADSIVLIDAVKQIEQVFGLKIPIRQLFGPLSTLDALASHLDQILPPDKLTPVAPSTADALTDNGQEKHITPMRLEQPDSTMEHAALLIEQRQALPATNDIERIFARQLDILSQQLEVLRSYAPEGSQRPTYVDNLTAIHSISNSSNGSSHVKTADVAVPATTQTPYVPYHPIRPKGTETLNQRQQQHAEKLSSRLIQRTHASREYAQRYRTVMADNRASAGFRFSIKEMLYPIVAERSQGAYFWDIDDNRYLDITMGFGVNLFGHRAPFIQEALARQLEKGIQLGPQSSQVGEVATLIHELTGAERVAFCNSGTEAVMTAMRLARAATGKNKIVIFSGSYHGTFDGVLALPQPMNEHAAQPLAPGVPEKMADDMLVLPYGSAHSLDIIQAHAHELAAVLVEPVQSRHPNLQPGEFLQQLRALTKTMGVALIFDETITGFRIHPGGAQAWFDIQADLVTYGKIVGGGMPIGMVTGKANYMNGIDGGIWSYGDQSYPQAETTFFAGTFCKHPLAMSSAHAVLTHLKSQGPALQEQLNAKTARLAATLNAFFQDEDVPITCIYFSSLFRFSFTNNMDLFFYHLLDKGIYIWEGRNCFLSTAHTDQDIATLIQAIKETIWELRDGGFFPTPPSGGTRQKHDEHEAAKIQDNLNSAASFPPEVLALRRQNANTQAVEQNFPLTAAQHNFWAASQVDTHGGFNAYIETALLQLDGEFSLPAMQEAFQVVVHRHEALRTVISAQGDVQRILPEMQTEVSYQDLSSVPAAHKPPLVARWLDDARYQGLDLTQGPLVLLSILKQDEERHLLIFAAHHIIADGWSIALALQEIAQVYTAQVKQQAYHLDAPLQLREYVHWQEQQVQQGMFLSDEQFWLTQLAKPFPALAFPFDHPHTRYKTFTGARVSMSLNADLQRALRQLASQNGCTLFMVLLSAYLLWLHQVCDQKDVVVGVPTAGRICMGSETLVGHAMNLFPLRSTLEGSPTFREYLRSIKQKLLELYEHQDYPLAALQKKFELQNQSYTPSTTFNLDPAIGFDGLGELTVTTLAPPVKYVKFDIAVFVTAGAEHLDVDFHYNSDLFEMDTMHRLTQHLRQLLECMCTSPDLPAWRQSLLLDAEIKQRAETGNQSHSANAPHGHHQLLPLSSTQQRLWLLDQLETGNSSDNTTSAMRLRGKLHLDSFQRSLHEIIARHESLRTRFQVLAHKPIQIINEAGNWSLSLLDLSALTLKEREVQMRALTQQESQSPFNLMLDPLLRVTLLRLSESEHALLLTTHRIIADDWSLTIIFRELSQLYDSFLLGKPSSLAPIPLHYADFAHWQHAWLQGEVLDRYVNYWTKQLKDAKPLELPADHPRLGLHDTLGSFYTFNFSAGLSEKLTSLSHQEDTTLFMTLLATFQTLLYRYTEQSDLLVGTSNTNRTQVDTDKVIGPFANLLALRTTLSGHLTFREVLHAIRSTVHDAYAHQDLPFEELIDLRSLEQTAHQIPLPHILFILQDTPITSLALHGMEITPLYKEKNETRFDLVVQMRTGAHGLSGEVNYRTALFDRNTIVYLVEHFNTLLHSVVSQPDSIVDRLEMYSETEKKKYTKNTHDSHEAHHRKLKTTRRNVIDFEKPPLAQ